MSKRYTYSRTINPTGKSDEIFSAVEFDSFDEAIRAVEKGIHDRRLQVAEEVKNSNGAAMIQGLGKKEEIDVEIDEEIEKKGNDLDLSNPLPEDDEEADVIEDKLR
jgi:hypothetical protein